MDELKKCSEEYLRLACNDPNAEFREGQWEAIETLVRERKRVLLVKRTGWGKSAVYFIASRLLRDQRAGPTLLISPLLALMRNQIEAAERLNISAHTVNSSNTDEWESVRADMLSNKVDVLLISPERLANEDFLENYLLPVASKIGLFVVDEAHCISDWGHDFRPDYRRIVRILRTLPSNIPVLATTATANDRVVADVVEQLGSDLLVKRGPLARKSLCLQNIELPDQAARMAWLAEQLPRIPGSGVVYTLTVRDSERVTSWLRSQGIDAKAYHSRLTKDDERQATEQALLQNEVKAVIATTALGMGFDKPDLGFVIHFQRPGSVVHYYQQVGRAGRAVSSAYGVMLCGKEDDEIAEYFIKTAFPPQANVEVVLQALEHAENGLTLSELKRQVNLSYRHLEKALKWLSVESPSPVSKKDNRWHRNPVEYWRDQDKIDRLIRIRHHEQERMREYMQSRECLMMFLARELGDPDPERCGKCAVCLGEPILPSDYSRELAEKAQQFLRGSDVSFEPRKRWPENALTDYEFGGRIEPGLQFQPGRALCLWGDAGWGDLVRSGKQKRGRFDDQLVVAAECLIRERWRPEPFPRWVTCVPSIRTPGLVPGFADRLAKALGIPFVPCIKKVRETKPQKQMENSYHQAKNLDGAFSVTYGEVISEPALLVDDMVDSRWTFTVLAALLQQGGSGPVFPIALAMTTKQR